MDYNELNDFLKNLEVKEKEVNNIYNKKLDSEFNKYRHSENKNALFINNKKKDVVLERDLRLNNKINYEIEIANPQRFNETRLKKNPNDVNSKLNNYNFNDFSTMYRNNHTTDISENFNMNTKNVIKNDINDKLNTRDKLPNNAIFSFNNE
tara:strand:+ start:33 stop:485 length:453 start_codon:yes stop_codon:yes gene_type:complete